MSGARENQGPVRRQEEEETVGNGTVRNRGDEEAVGNFLLLVATLIVTVTFQAGVNPPGGVWQESGAGNAGKAIFASQPGAFYVFLFSNTIGLSTSIVAIICLIGKGLLTNFDVVKACYPAIVIATVAMIVTYGSAIFAVSPRDSVMFRLVWTAFTLPFIAWGLFLWFNKRT